MPSKAPAPQALRHCRNEVLVCGRVAAAAEERQLPSGNAIVTARIIVARDPDAMGRSAQRVDTLDCVAWKARVQRSMRLWEAGQYVRIEGAIRRRFFRGAAGPMSRVEIEVRATRRVPASPTESEVRHCSS